MSTDGDRRNRQHDGPPALPVQAHSVRADVVANFGADAPVATNHKITAGVESEFKTRSEKGQSFYVLAEVEGSWTAGS